VAFSVKKMLFRGIDVLFGKAAKIFHHPHKSTTPLADRLLADALRIAELSSPAPGEEPRAAFVMERLNHFNLVPVVTESGSVKVRLHAEQAADETPVLLFTRLGSDRWHPIECLARLDAENAVGAGLSDSLGTAALLSVAENYAAGDFKPGRDLLLLFTARSPEAPDNGLNAVINNPVDRPIAAIGVRGFSLGRIIHSTGSYCLRITLSTETDETSNRLTTTLIEITRSLLGITWDGEGKTRLFIRRIEAGTVYGLTPCEGIIEIEVESVEGSLLELAMNVVKATAEKVAAAAQLKYESAQLSYIPPGAPEKSGGLFEKVRAIARDLRIKVSEENGTDPAAFFTAGDIPALSVGIALGKEGALGDTIRIDSVEKGRRLLERLIIEAGT
jgi:hypothetical protein